MVREGIPHSLRPYVWMRLTGALQKKAASEMSYKQIVKASTNDHLVRFSLILQIIGKFYLIM
jgi:hypothetical protein